MKPVLALLFASFVLGCGSGGAPADGAADAAITPKTTPDAKYLPTPTGACPTIADGEVTFAPAGVAPRKVILSAGAVPEEDERSPLRRGVAPRKVILSAGADATAKGGPLVFFWHGAGGDPSEATYALGSAVAEIKSMGGVVAAPYHDEASGELPWFLSIGGSREDDLRLADEILACAIQQRGVDVRRIHSVGFSAGAMNTAQLALRRSGYIASVVLYSGALIDRPDAQDEQNRYPAMLFYGGPNDQVGVNFDDASHAYHDYLTEQGHFSFLCNHGRGHTVPSDGRASAWQFLKDHPFGASPEPYASGLPAGFPSYCGL